MAEKVPFARISIAYRRYGFPVNNVLASFVASDGGKLALPEPVSATMDTAEPGAVS